MIVFRKNERVLNPGQFLKRLRLISEKLDNAPLNIENARIFLMETGEFEGAVCDFFSAMKTLKLLLPAHYVN